MQNKNKSVQAIFKILAVSAVYMAIAPMAMAQPIAMPIPIGTPLTSAVSAPEASKLIYKAPGSTLTVEELAAAQRKKMEEEFFKKAGYTSTPPVVVVAKSGEKSKAVNTEKPKSSISLVGIYGTEKSQKAEILYNGQLMVVTSGARIGNASIDSIQDGRVYLSHPGASKAKFTKQKSAKNPNFVAEPVRQSLKSGDVLEFVN